MALGAGLISAVTAFAQPRAPDAPVALKSGSLCLDVFEPQLRTNGGRVQLAACDGRPSQGWRADRGRLVNVGTGRCLDVHGPDVGFNGARIQVSDCHGGANQGWRYERGQWIAQADGRCLDVHAPDLGIVGARVQTWDCRGGANQQWGADVFGPPPAAARDLEAGPLFNQGEAERKCPAVCAPARWNGQWRTTVPGRMSVCGCVADAGASGLPPPAASPAGPQPMSDARFDELLRAMAAEGFPSGQLGVLDGAARDNRFTIAQLRRIVESFSFSGDRIRAVEIVAPRVVDRQNAFALYSVFSFDTERQQARAIFDRLR